MIVKTIVTFFNSKYPFANAAEWDQVGLQLGTMRAQVKAIVVALDLTKATLALAINRGANLIIVHHPFLFNEEFALDLAQSPYKKALFEQLQSQNINVLVLHTNYDQTNKRTAMMIAQRLSLSPLPSTSQTGLLFNRKMTISKLQALLETRLGFEIQNHNLELERVYSRWGLLPGSGDPAAIALLHQEGAEFILTSDIKWSTWVTARNDNFQLVAVSHAIEDVFTSDVAATIHNQWPNIAVFENCILR